MTYFKTQMLPTGLLPLATLLALSFVPRVEAQQVCTTNASGKTSCHYHLSDGDIVGIVLAVLIVLGIGCALFFSCRQCIRARKPEAIANQMVFVPDIVVPPPATNVMPKPPRTAPVWGTRYHPETGQPTGAPPGRSTRYSVSFAKEPQYPALAYPFTGLRPLLMVAPASTERKPSDLRPPVARRPLSVQPSDNLKPLLIGRRLSMQPGKPSDA